jgi:hypothetical protein
MIAFFFVLAVALQRVWIVMNGSDRRCPDGLLYWLAYEILWVTILGINLCPMVLSHLQSSLGLLPCVSLLTTIAV